MKSVRQSMNEAVRDDRHQAAVDAIMESPLYANIPRRWVDGKEHLVYDCGPSHFSIKETLEEALDPERQPLVLLLKEAGISDVLRKELNDESA